MFVGPPTVHTVMPDVLGLQEATPLSLQALVEVLPNHDLVRDTKVRGWRQESTTPCQTHLFEGVRLF